MISNHKKKHKIYFNVRSKNNNHYILKTNKEKKKLKIYKI